MPYIPHTDSDIRKMLDTIGVERIEQLFDEIPAEIKSKVEKLTENIAPPSPSLLSKEE